MIVISDLPEVVIPGNTIAFYADDCKTSRVIICPSNCYLFQYAICTEKLNLLSLEDTCFLLDVLFLSKVLNRYIGIDISTYIQFYTDSDRYHFRRRDELTLKRTFVRTTTFKRIFFK